MRSEHEPLTHAARPRHLFRCFDAERQEIALGDPAIGGLVRDVVRSSDRKPVLIFGNTISHLAPVFHRLLGARLRLLHLHRHPVVTAASMYVRIKPEWWRRPAHEEDPYGMRISPFDPHARFVEYRDRWGGLSLFERILYEWAERHAAALETHARLPDVPFLSVSSEELFAAPAGVVARLAEFAGLDPMERVPLDPARRNATWDRSREQRPLGDVWRVYESHPVVLELADRLGHRIDPRRLERQMERYQLPPGLMPWIRHRTRYWELRGRAAGWLRTRGIVPPSSDAMRGMPPRRITGALREALLRRRG